MWNDVSGSLAVSACDMQGRPTRQTYVYYEAYPPGACMKVVVQCANYMDSLLVLLYSA